MTINPGFSLFVVTALGLSACSAEKASADSAAQIGQSEPSVSVEPGIAAEANMMIALDGEGLRIVNSETGSTRVLPFGTARAATQAAIVRILGSPDGDSSNAECGAGPMDFQDFGDFTANFQDGLFVGWSLRGGEKRAALTTMSGIGIGTTRSEMAKSGAFEIYEDSTIGTEFQTAGFSGLLDSDAPDAKITDLWAGTNCIFR